jgi:thiol:disulfide interchange protein DsbA
MRITRVLAIAATLLTLSVHAHAAGSPEDIFEGRDYDRLERAQPLPADQNVEVTELFWYQCPHCFALEPGLNKWAKTLPRNTVLRRVPAVYNPRWQPAAQIYYALAEMKLLDKLHDKVFEAFHAQHRDLTDQTTRDKWLAEQGVVAADFERAFNSPSVAANVALAARITTEYNLDGVPVFVVDGKYVTSVGTAGSETRLFEVLDQLIAKARAERKQARHSRRETAH